jgi:hypothetical protein
VPLFALPRFEPLSLPSSPSLPLPLRSRLSSLSLRLFPPPDTPVDAAALPLAPRDLPAGLEELSVEAECDASFALPLGDYLG